FLDQDFCLSLVRCLNPHFDKGDRSDRDQTELRKRFGVWEETQPAKVDCRFEFQGWDVLLSVHHGCKYVASVANEVFETLGLKGKWTENQPAEHWHYKHSPECVEYLDALREYQDHLMAQRPDDRRLRLYRDLNDCERARPYACAGTWTRQWSYSEHDPLM